MTLKRQLLIASLLMLIIPWAGLQFVLELDQALREQASRQLQSQARRMAPVADAALADGPAIATGTEVIYADPLTRTLNLDGYGDDWPGYDEEEPHQEWQATRPGMGMGRDMGIGAATLSWQAATDQRYLYLLIRVERPDPAYFNPGNPEQPYEFLRLRWREGDGTVERHIRTPAPGPVTGWKPGRTPEPDYRITGVWEASGPGYQMELRLPLPARGTPLGFEVVWPTANTPEIPIVMNFLGTDQEPLPRLLVRSPELEHQLGALLAPGQQVRVLEPAGWVLAKDTLATEGGRPEFDSLSPLEILEQISLNGLRALVRFHQPEPTRMDDQSRRIDTSSLPTKGLVRHAGGGTFLVVSQPLENGRLLVLEQSLDQLLALSGTTLGSVIARSTLLIIGLMLVLLGYASWLSWRITKLQRAVNASVDDDGRILGRLPASRARDELGELSRQFSHMVERLQGYTHYLESFSRRLSHELKTPVAVMRSSLENLNHATSSEDRASYIARATAATDRLSQILQGMSEAARLEQSFDHAEKEAFDLADVAAQATQAYQSLDPAHRINYRGPAHGCTLHGSPELLVQLLDKLVDNARDFTPDGGAIEVCLQARPRHLELSVFNEGSSLPGHLASEIFSPFVSLREGSQEGHLGQGLLIVRLIAEHHGGQVQACNDTSEGRSGVRFTVTLHRYPST